jgi:hypothetical protein
MEVLVTPSCDRRNSEMEWDQRSRSWCIDGPDLFVNSHLAVPVMKGLITPSHDSRDSEMESDQRSRSNLDLTAKIKPRSVG